MAFNANKITCDPIDNVPDCNIRTTPYVTPSNNGYEPHQQAVRSVSESSQPDGTIQQGQNGKDISFNENNSHVKPRQINFERNGQENLQQPTVKKGDLFYLWNFDGQTGFDEYVSLEEAAKMQYKMPDDETNMNYINPNRQNSVSDKDIVIDFTDRPKPSILQNSSPPKPFAHIEPKIGSEAIAGYHVWDLHHNNPVYQNLKQSGYQHTDPEVYNMQAVHGIFQSHYQEPYEQYNQKPQAYSNIDSGMAGTVQDSIISDSDTSAHIDYNSPGNIDYNRNVEVGKVALPVAKQGLTHHKRGHPGAERGHFGAERGHYGSIRPSERTYRRPSPKLIPFDDRGNELLSVISLRARH